MVKAEPSDIGTEDSMDGGPPSVCSSDMGAPSTPNSNSNFTATTFTSKKVSAYVLISFVWTTYLSLFKDIL